MRASLTKLAEDRRAQRGSGSSIRLLYRRMWLRMSTLWARVLKFGRLQHMLRRAVRRASRPGFGTPDLWCGHSSRLGEYMPEAADAHLLRCPRFPQDGKQQIWERQRRKNER
jgi:hypothetical protein